MSMNDWIRQRPPASAEETPAIPAGSGAGAQPPPPEKSMNDRIRQAANRGGGRL